MTNELSGNLEENVLTLLTYDDVHATEISLRLNTPKIFATRPYQVIATAAMHYLEVYNRPPKQHIRDLLEDRIKKGNAESRIIEEACISMHKWSAELQPQYIMDQLDDYIAGRNIVEAVEAAMDKLNDGDIEAAQEALHKPIIPSKFSIGTILQDAEQSLRFLDKKEEDYFPSGIEVLDSLGIHPRRKAMFLFIAPAKKGKSWFLVQMGKEALMHHKSVLHVTLEMSEEQVSQRYIQALYGMSEDDAEAVSEVYVFIRDKETRREFIGTESLVLHPKALNIDAKPEVTKKLRSLKRKPPLIIKEFPSGMLTIQQLTIYLDMLEKKHNIRPDLLIIDYPDLMQHRSNYKREDLGSIFVAVRGIAMSRNIAVATVTQGNRQSAESRTVYGTQVSEDYSKIATADTIITYSQTESEHESSMARIWVDGARGRRDKFSVLISQAYSVGQFCWDSILFSKVPQSVKEEFHLNDAGIIRGDGNKAKKRTKVE